MSLIVNMTRGALRQPAAYRRRSSGGAIRRAHRLTRYGVKHIGNLRLLRPRPDDPLVFLRHRRESLVEKSLDPVPLVGFGGVNVPLGIAGNDVHAIELPGLAAAIAERGQFLEGVAPQDVNELVFTVADVEIRL